MTAVSAIPITQGESFTWCFDTRSATQGDVFDNINYLTTFSGDFWNLFETLQWVWTDEINSLPISKFYSENSVFDNVSAVYIGSNLVSAWIADESLYMTITMVTGSVNVDPNPRLISLSNNITGAGEFLDVSGSPVQGPIPEPTTMLLVSTGLVGLAGFRKRFKKSNGA